MHTYCDEKRLAPLCLFSLVRSVLRLLRHIESTAGLQQNRPHHRFQRRCRHPLGTCTSLVPRRTTSKSILTRARPRRTLRRSFPQIRREIPRTGAFCKERKYLVPFIIVDEKGVTKITATTMLYTSNPPGKEVDVRLLAVYPGVFLALEQLTSKRQVRAQIPSRHLSHRRHPEIDALRIAPVNAPRYVGTSGHNIRFPPLDPASLSSCLPLARNC